ncbi:MAG: tetratricopeptide repeat protein [Marinifilaceae bacterium]
MRNRFRWLIYVSTWLLLISGELCAQQTMVFNKSDKAWREGKELFRDGNYGAARKAFDQVLNAEENRFSDRYANAQFYIAWCDIELFRPNAEEEMKAFIREHPESTKLQKAYLQLGHNQYRNKKYRAALVWYQQVDSYQLKGEEAIEFRFKLGYCYFVRNELDKAAREFYEIKDVSGQYYSSANYYYSHIAYLNKKYQTALEGFEKLNDTETFAPIVPYYICQIYYLQEKYEKILSYAPSYLEEASTQRIPEIARIIGQSHYRLNQFEKALPYLERFRKEGPGMQREDKFELGYCYYRVKQYEKAAELLEQLGGKEDAMLQTGSYCLADCYLKMGDKQRAKAAFATTARMEFDANMQQDALFNFAKIAYELSYSPFNETIKAFDKYLQKYPDSDRNDEAYDYLVKVYMTTRNYKEALLSMDKIRRKTPAIEEAYQRVAYLRALELFKQLQYGEALTYFDSSLNYRQYNRQITAEALYWKAEAMYRTGKFEDAIHCYRDFLQTPGASLTELFDRAYYNLGYSYFKQKQYEEATSWFRKFENRRQDRQSAMLCDARNRIGDYYFLNREYALAAKYYGKAAAAGLWDADYALYQKAFAMGLQRNQAEKIRVLDELLSKYGQSAYADDALFEKGKAFVNKDQETQAIPCYEKLIREFPASPYMSKSLLQLGLLSYNQKRFEEAITYYKKVVAQNPESQEAKSALIGLKNIYVDLNRVDEYFAFTQTVGKGGMVNHSERDSLSYISAERLYMSGKQKEASLAFHRYLNQYPEGQFVLNASYYKAESDLHQGKDEEALLGFERVIDHPKNWFTEQSLLKASGLNYQNENFARAGEQYRQLAQMAQLPANRSIARIGAMRCAYRLEDYAQTLPLCDKVLATEKVGEEIVREARYYKAKSNQSLRKSTAALEGYRKLAVETQSKEGAEAKYQVAQLLFDQNRVDDAEKEINSYIEMNSPHQYWLAESFILLADVYLKKGDAFQARYTLQSIVDNYTNTEDGIVPRAKDKLEKLLAAEQAEAEKAKAAEIKLKFKQKGKEDYQELFEEAPVVKDTLGLDESKLLLQEMLEKEDDNI